MLSPLGQSQKATDNAGPHHDSDSGMLIQSCAYILRHNGQPGSLISLRWTCTHTCTHNHTLPANGNGEDIVSRVSFSGQPAASAVANSSSALLIVNLSIA